MIRHIKFFDYYALDLPTRTVHFWTVTEAERCLRRYLHSKCKQYER